jgi:hypothetical protein
MQVLSEGHFVYPELQVNTQEQALQKFQVPPVTLAGVSSALAGSVWQVSVLPPHQELP